MLRLRPASDRQVDQMFAMMGEDLTNSPELRQVMVTFERLPAYAATWLELLNSVMRLRGARPGMALTSDDLARISQPVQLIWGEQDPFGPPEVGEEAAKIIEEAEFHRIPGGHVPWLSQAELIADLVIPFLEKQSSSG